jgi:hypothetical protein
MALLRERPLFHALSRRIWELREELDLLERWVAFKSQAEGTTARFSSDFHLPGTYRGGIVARLQNLLMQLPDGTFLTRVEMERAGRPVRAARGHER